MHKIREVLYKTHKFFIILNIISFISLLLSLLKIFNAEIFNNFGKTIAWFSSVYIPLIMIPFFFICLIFRINWKTSLLFLLINSIIIYKAIEYLNANLYD